MPIYDKPTWRLMREMADEMGLTKGQVITKDQVLAWFVQRYPKIKKGTITAHLTRMSTNARGRLHHRIKPGDDDLFFQVDGSRYRLYDPETDPPPIHKGINLSGPDSTSQMEEVTEEAAAEFAYEDDLRHFLSRNLHLLEPGLRLYEDEGISGVEFPAGGRFIDILAVDNQQGLIVIELKVSRGYDRAVGQLLRYMGWVTENLAEPSQRVRGFMVARDISEDPLLACKGLPNVELFEHELSVSVQRLQRQRTVVI